MSEANRAGARVAEREGRKKGFGTQTLPCSGAGNRSNTASFYSACYRTSVRTGLLSFNNYYPQKMNTFTCPLLELLRPFGLYDLMQPLD